MHRLINRESAKQEYSNFEVMAAASGVLHTLVERGCFTKEQVLEIVEYFLDAAITDKTWNDVFHKSQEYEN